MFKTPPSSTTLSAAIVLAATTIAHAKPDSGPTMSARDWAKTASVAELTAFSHEPHELIVRLDLSNLSAADASLNAILRSTGGRIRWESRLVPGLLVIEIDAAVGKSLDVARGRSNGVLYAHPAYTLNSQATNDPLWHNLWGLRNDGDVYTCNGCNDQPVHGVTGIDIRMEEAWQIQPNADGVIVAVVDSGVDLEHEDLAEVIWTNTNETPGNNYDDDGNGYADDVNGWSFSYDQPRPLMAEDHGTHCSGTIAAKADNDIGLVGVARGASIMPLQFMMLGADGQTSGSTTSAMAAIEYAVANGARISNHSWGGPAPSEALREVIANAGNQGHLFICAAGNEGGPVGYPAGFDLDCIVSVAAIRPDGELASFSNRGEGVDLAAPGWGIKSCVAGGYAHQSGTSMASPHVAGVAALLLAHSGGTATAAQIKQALLSSTHPLDSLTNNVETGGMLDAAAALTALDGGGGGDETPSDTYGILQHVGADPINLSITLTPDGQGWAMCRDEVTALPSGNGGGNLELGDDDTTWQGLRWPFPFAGESYTQVQVHSNGSVTFTEAIASWEATPESFALAPRIAPMMADLNPSIGGRVTVLHLDDRTAFTWFEVPSYGSNDTNTMQVELFEDGRIRMTWMDIPVASAQQNIIGVGAAGVAQSSVNMNMFDSCQDVTPPSGPCTGDLDENRRVDVVDLIQLLEAWGQCD
ncbi:MAG: S8 family peptidase [Phycisphaerales bacterium]|nr:S8 family peptidase [Phycisphaerales bacterium]